MTGSYSDSAIGMAAFPVVQTATIGRLLPDLRVLRVREYLRSRGWKHKPKMVTTVCSLARICGCELLRYGVDYRYTESSVFLESDVVPVEQLNWFPCML